MKLIFRGIFSLLLSAQLFAAENKVIRTVKFPLQVVYQGLKEHRNVVVVNQGTIADMFNNALAAVRDCEAVAFRPNELLTYRVYIGGNAYQRVVRTGDDIDKTFHQACQSVAALEKQLGRSAEYHPVGSRCYERWDQWRAIGGALPVSRNYFVSSRKGS